jgi:hypothetical protein
MAEMTQFRQEISASEKANVSTIGDISQALAAALSLEREKVDQERAKLTTEVASLINAMVEGQQARWLSAVENVRQDLASSQSRVQGGYQLVSKGLDSWADREGAFSKKLLVNKEDVKKSIVEASKVTTLVPVTDNRLRIDRVAPFKTAHEECTRKQLNWWIVR